jgi:hypothetical protein
MTTLKINLNGAGVSVGMFAVSSQTNQVQLDFTHYKDYVTAVGLDDWTQWINEFSAVLNTDQKSLITFEVL